MREDLNKALTERPRVGHTRKHKHVRAKYNRFDFDEEDDDAPGGIEGMKKPYGRGGYSVERKTNSDLWGVMRRFMASRAGRPWNDVMHEIVNDLRESDDMRAHFMAHVRIEVDEKLDIAANGRLYRPRGNWRFENFDWDETFPGEIPGCFKRFYVDPRDGVLHKTPERPKGWVSPRWRNRKEEHPPNGYVMPDGVQIKYIDGIWYQITAYEVRVGKWSRFPDPDWKTTGRHYRLVFDPTYHETNYTKRQLNKKELKKYGVANAVS